MDLQRVRVLIIGDNPFSLWLTRSTLHALNIRTIAEANGVDDGIAALESFAPDLILVDWEMPPDDGIEFVKRVRSNTKLDARFTPIILVSGYSEMWRVQVARDARVNEYVVKPYTAKALYAKIRAIAENPRPFISAAGGYFGPDRRRRLVVVAHERRYGRQTDHGHRESELPEQNSKSQNYKSRLWGER